jgi:hypothetical protein
MAKGGKNFKSKPAGKFAVKAGPSGGMHNFEAMGAQKPGVSGVSMSGGGKSFGDKLKTGGSGKMAKFKGVGPVKKA